VATLYFIRHARPTASFGDSVDPGLDDLGQSQAQAVAEHLRRLTRPLPIYSSPLRRCRETAQPLGVMWTVQPRIFPEVGEIPSPPLSLEERQTWLRCALGGTWADLKQSAPEGSPDFDEWRTRLLNAVRAMAGDSVIFSHYIAINAIVGSALGNEQVVSFRPDYASVTIIEVSEGRIAIRELGSEAGEGGTVLAGR
jgi:broad specificity phosphatase PhoE